MLYLMNTTMMPNPNGTYKSAIISLQEAKDIVKGDFTSAVGHSVTAELMSEVLGTVIRFNRMAVSLEDGDKMLCFKLKPRIVEGVLFSSKEVLEALGYDFVLISYSSS